MACLTGDESLKIDQKEKKKRDGLVRGVKGHLLSWDNNLNPGRFSSVHGSCSLERDIGKAQKSKFAWW